MAAGIRDKVAIIGMGCCRFGERWDAGPEELIVEAFEECLDDAGIERDQIEAAWLGIFFDEQSIEPVLSDRIQGERCKIDAARQIDGKSVIRVVEHPEGYPSYDKIR